MARRSPGSRPHTTGVAGGRSLVRRQRMRMRVTTEVDGLEEALAYSEKLGDRVLVELFRRITTATVIVQREITASILTTFIQRTGKFLKSWQIRIISRRAGGPSQLAGGNVLGIVGTDHPAAWIQNVGGIARAKNSWLPVPISDLALQKRASGMGKLAVTAGGELIEHRLGQDIIHFVLRKAVRLQATHYLDRAVEKAAPKVFAEVGKGVQVVVEGKNK